MLLASEPIPHFYIFFFKKNFVPHQPNQKQNDTTQSQTAIHDMMPPMKPSHNLRVYDFRFSTLPEGISSVGEKSAQLEVLRSSTERLRLTP